MGYQTDFTGKLIFTRELTIPQLKKLNSFLGDHVDDHHDLAVPVGGKAHYIQFKVTPEMDGIQWDGTEKFYEAVNAVNTIIINMRNDFPDFGLKGKLEANGEEFDDKWHLVVEDNTAKRVDIVMDGQKIECPHCEERFYYEG